MIKNDKSKLSDLKFHETMMELALDEAKKAELMGEVPIGAIIVKDGFVIGKGHNTREGHESPLGHAELNAISSACSKLGSWRLTGCDIYVTIEPCPMCVGAIYQSRIRTIFYGANDVKAGACGSLFNLFEVKGLNHYCEVVPGILKEKGSTIITDFFKKKR
ncbi:nucleoside deaminase [Fusibacter bizertensis]